METPSERLPDESAPTDIMENFRHRSPEALLHLLSQASRRRRARLDARLAPLGLKAVHGQVLAIIRRMPGCAMSDLAAHTAIDRTTLTRNVDRLVAEGLVARRTAPGDRRQVSLELSARGAAVCDRAFALAAAEDAALLRGVSASDVACATRVLEAVVTQLAGEEAAAIIGFGSGWGARRARRSGPS